MMVRDRVLESVDALSEPELARIVRLIAVVKCGLLSLSPSILRPTGPSTASSPRRIGGSPSRA